MTMLRNKRVLIVEDNGIIGDMVADMMTEEGIWPIGPALTESDAIDMIDGSSGRPDAAILDVGLDRRSTLVADRLQELGIPFIFATGMPDQIPVQFSHVPVCAKPYRLGDLLSALHLAIDPPRGDDVVVLTATVAAS